jgi:hypothetical protein
VHAVCLLEVSGPSTRTGRAQPAGSGLSTRVVRKALRLSTRVPMQHQRPTSCRSIATYAVWTGLAIVSSRRYRYALPGSFSRRHRKLGWAVFSALCFTAASASAMYLFAFVL